MWHSDLAINSVGDCHRFLQSILLSVVVCTVLGVVIEKVAYSPLRKASSNLAVLITAIGVSYLLQNVALLIFGADAQKLSLSCSESSVCFIWQEDSW